MSKRWSSSVLALAIAFVWLPTAASCGGDNKTLFTRVNDAGDASADATDDAADATDAAIDPTLGGPCVDDAQCNDGFECSFDSCDQGLHRCRNVPDDTRCSDGLFCNGRERCVLARGCSPGPVETCQDGSSCTIDRCNEATRSCEHVLRDVDRDGDPDDRCSPLKDCNDLDPNVASTHSEVCNNGVDDDCDGTKDEASCVTASNDLCTTALAIAAPGTYGMTTAGSKKDYPVSCGAVGNDVVASVTIPAGGPKDLDVWVTAPGAFLSVAIQSTCGAPATELACGSAVTASAARARARNLAPGTYAVIVTSDKEGPFELAVDFRTPAPAATNESCGNAEPIMPGVAKTVELLSPSKDLASACVSGTGELTYALELLNPADVRIYASTVRGSGVPVVGLRSPACASPSDELRCRTGTPIPVFARGLAAGTYIVTLAGTAPIDASLVVQTSAPTTAPADQTCAAPPPALVQGTMPFDLSNHEDAIKDGCFPGGPQAAFALPLAQASDVLLIGRFPPNEVGSVSLDGAACTAPSRLACDIAVSPVRVNKRNVPIGDYRVVVADSLAQQGTLTTLVRPATAPTIVTGSDGCGPNVVEVPPDGGFFTGDTSNTSLLADFGGSCDSTNAGSGGGARDQVLRLVLPTTKRVVLDMDGSTYTTLLDVRQGATCPGQEVPGACFVGFSGARSFLDLTLAAGTYWIVLDGYNMASGPWNLDVRVLAP